MSSKELLYCDWEESIYVISLPVFSQRSRIGYDNPLINAIQTKLSERMENKRKKKRERVTVALLSLVFDIQILN